MPTQEEIVEALGNMPVIRLCELIHHLEDKWGVKAAPVPSYDVVGGDVRIQPPPEQTEFDVVLTAAGTKRIDVIKIVRSATGLGLKEAKDLVEAAGPTIIRTSLPTSEAQALKSQLEAAGALVELK